MRYFYQKPDNYIMSKGRVYRCDHPLYSECTLYKEGDIGLAVVQRRYNSRLKAVWWASIDPWLVDDIWQQAGFKEYFNQHADRATNGIFPTVNVRKLMWALKMKPLPRQDWENDI